MKGKAADYHMLLRMIGEIKVPRDRFRCVLVVFLYVTKVFSESVAKSSPCFVVSLFRHRRNRETTWRNVSFRISLRWPIHIINPVDETKLSCYTSHRRSTTVSLETYPSIRFKLKLHNMAKTRVKSLRQPFVFHSSSLLLDCQTVPKLDIPREVVLPH